MPDQIQMPKGWRSVRLGDVAEINPRRPRLRVPAETPVTFLPMAAIEERAQGIIARDSRPYCEVSTGYIYFEENDFLFSKIMPCLPNGKHTFVGRGGHGIPSACAFRVRGGGPTLSTTFGVVEVEVSLSPATIGD